MVEITPDGQLIPIAAGLRSPCGFTVSSQGDWFFTDNQGEWVGSGRITHVEPGDFTGHPAGLSSSKLAGSTVKLRPEDIPSTGEPMHEVAQRIPGIKPPAVWLPHTILGISNAGIIEDLSGGKFGPFAGQFFVGDQGQSKVVRVTMEKVKGVWQGAAYAFREGFECGIIRLALGEMVLSLLERPPAAGVRSAPNSKGSNASSGPAKCLLKLKRSRLSPTAFSSLLPNPSIQ